MDVVSKSKRSQMMAGIRGKNTRPELRVRRLLHAAGLRFRLHRRDLPGTPDLVFPKYRAVVFVHGCFWHSHRNCSMATIPTSNVEFWTKKLAANRDRDVRHVGALLASGWRVLVVYECATKRPETAGALLDEMVDWLKSDALLGEIPKRESE